MNQTTNERGIEQIHYQQANKEHCQLALFRDRLGLDPTNQLPVSVSWQKFFVCLPKKTVVSFSNQQKMVMLVVIST